jgi:hypothetical protein
MSASICSHEKASAESTGTTGKEVHRLAMRQSLGKHRSFLRCPHSAGKRHRESACYRHQRHTGREGCLSHNSAELNHYHLKQRNDKTLSEIDNRLVELQTELLKLANSKADYEDVADEIYRLRDQKQKAMLENEQRKRIADMSEILQEPPSTITEYNKQLVRRLIEKVTVYEDKFAVGIQVRCDG